MSAEFGLAIGESFAELQRFPAIGQGAVQASVKCRWYLPKKNLAEGLKEALKDVLPDASNGSKLGRLQVATSSVDRALAKSQGRSPALVVTSGLESWLGFQQPFSSALFSMKTERRELIVEQDQIFGVSERVNAQGQITNALSIEELEFLVSKFELLKVKDIAIGFLHAKRNPVHEQQAVNFFRERGFRAVSSHEQYGATEIDRWRLALECAFAESAIREEKEQLETAIDGRLELSVWTAEGPLPMANYSAQAIRLGKIQALKNLCTTSAGKRDAWTLHCGLDEFYLLGPQGEECRPLLMRPTQLVRHGIWPFPHYAVDSSRFEPGPMCFGKSQQLAALDVFFARDRLLDTDGLTPLLVERMRPRILDTLFTLAKSPQVQGAHRRPPDPLAVANDLVIAFIERLNVELALAGASEQIVLSGPLAETFSKLLKARRPDVSFAFSPAASWSESEAAASKLRGGQ